jgi:hypothetical protein
MAFTRSLAWRRSASRNRRRRTVEVITKRKAAKVINGIEFVICLLPISLWISGAQID